MEPVPEAFVSKRIEIAIARVAATEQDRSATWMCGIHWS
jgi:hypothetical protein